MTDKPRRQLVYIGVRPWLKGGALAHCFYPVTSIVDEIPENEDDLFASIAIWKRGFGRFRPGAIISIEHDPGEPGQVYGLTARTEGHVDDAVAAKWRSISTANELAATTDREAKKDAKRDIDLELIEPIREAYQNLRNKNERAVLIGRVIAFLTKGGRL